jgi:hypothetical protein
MKTYTTILLILVCNFCFSQNKLNSWGFGGGLGFTMEDEFNVMQQKETFMPKSLSFTMVGSYFKDNWLLESSGTYCGAILWNLNAGYSFPLRKDLRLDLTAGINDNIMVSFKKLQIVHDFEWNGTVRIQWKDLTVSANTIFFEEATTYIFTLGVRCFNKSY